jgi:hypothetical protein
VNYGLHKTKLKSGEVAAMEITSAPKNVTSPVRSQYPTQKRIEEHIVMPGLSYLGDVKR